MKSKFKTLLSKTDIQLLCISVLMVTLFYSINFSIEYATDTYSTFQESDTWKWMFYENGRLFNALIYYIIENIGISGGYIYKLSYLLSLFCLSIANMIFAKILHEFCDNKILCCLVSFLTISNLFIIEYYLFIEKGLFMLAILLCTLAAYYTISYFKTKRIRFLVITLALLIWAVFVYQIILGLYIILCLPFILKFSSSFIDFVRKNIIIACLYATPLLSAYVILKFILDSSRTGEIGNLFINTLNTIPIFITITTTKWYILPENLFLLLLLTILLSSIIIAWYFKKQKNIVISLLSILYIFFVTVFTAFFPFISGVSNSPALRTIYPYGCIFGILITYVIISYPLNYKLIFERVCFIIVSSILVYQLLLFHDIFIERYRVNQCNQYFCEIVGYKIEEYEQQTGMTIDTICFYPDMSISWFDQGCDEFQISQRAQTAGWSNANAFNLYLNKNYIKGERDPYYEQYFSQLDWNTYSEDQLIFEGNTLHLAIY